MNPHIRYFRAALIALAAIAVSVSAEVSASTTSAGPGASGCARKCCAKPVDTDCCCRSKPGANDAQPRKALRTAHVQFNSASKSGLTCDCSLEVPSTPADRDSTATAKTVGPDPYPVTANFKLVDPFRDAIRRSAHSELPTPKIPVFLRMARLRI